MFDAYKRTREEQFFGGKPNLRSRSLLFTLKKADPMTANHEFFPLNLSAWFTLNRSGSQSFTKPKKYYLIYDFEARLCY
jgi:hypothetical protein